MPCPIPQALFGRPAVPGHDRVLWRLDPVSNGHRIPSLRSFLDEPDNRTGLWLFKDGHPDTPLRFRWIDGFGWDYGGLHGRLFDPPDPAHPVSDAVRVRVVGDRPDP